MAALLQALDDLHLGIDKKPMESFIGQVFLDIAGCHDVRFRENRESGSGSLQFQGSLDEQIRAIAREFFDRALGIESVKECIEKYDHDPEAFDLIKISYQIYNDAFLDIAFTNLAREPTESNSDDNDFAILRPSITYIELFDVLSEHYSDVFPFVNDLMHLIYAMAEEE
jgi:hypothetical protein